MSRYLGSALAIALMAWTCTKPNSIEDHQQSLMVQAYLSPGRAIEVELRQTLAPGSFYESLEDTVSGALLDVAVDGERFRLVEDPDRPGTYLISPELLAVESGKSYHLTATFGDRQLTAFTTVPEPPLITEVTADTITYLQKYSDLYGDLIHPGEFFWTRSANAAGYVIIVEAIDVHSLPASADALTADLDTLLARREQLAGEVSVDSIQAIARQIEELRSILRDGISRIAGEDTLHYLRDREEEEWREIDGKDWTEGRKWRERRKSLFGDRYVNYWIPADSLHSDFWWLGVRFEGEYQIRLQAADQNYFDYFSTAFNGLSGNDGDQGPLFHVEGGTGVFGSYAEDSRRIIALRGESPPVFKLAATLDHRQPTRRRD